MPPAAVNRNPASRLVVDCCGGNQLGVVDSTGAAYGAVGVILGTILSYLLVLVVPQTLIVRRVPNQDFSHRDSPSGQQHLTNCQ
jgi:hypothetical protein